MSLAPRRLLAILFAEDAGRLRAIAPQTNEGWQQLLARCEELGATGLLHAALRRTRTADLAPDDVRAAVRLAHATNVAHNLALHAEATRVLAVLHQAGLTAAPMKGVALFDERVVEDLGARPTGDFDLVTRTSERAAVLSTLSRLGYEARLQGWSWKHLPAVSRGDLSIEVHEIAYWSPTTKEIFDADHLARAERPARIGRLCALQVHHLVLGSPPDAGLAVRTLADVEAFLRLARREHEVRRAILVAAREGGVERELAACESLIAEARGASCELGLRSSAQDAERLLAPLRSTEARDVRADTLAHALRLLPRQPWRVTRDMISLIAFPPAEVVAARLSRADGAGSTRSGVTTARLRRPFELLLRVARALPTVLRTRPGPGA